MCTKKDKNDKNYEKFGISDEILMVFNFSHKNNSSKFAISTFATHNVDLFIANLWAVLYMKAN